MKKRILWIVAGVVLLFGAVGVFVGFGARAYEAMAQEASGAARQASVARDGVVAEVNTEKKGTDERYERLQQALKRAEIVPVCKLDNIYSWQSSFRYAKEAVASCQKSAAAIAEIHAALRPIKMFLDDEKRFIAALQPLMSENFGKTVNEKQLASSVSTVSNVLTEVVNLQVSDAYMPVKEAAVTGLKTIDKAWKNVAEANKQQKQKVFSDATANLTKSYTSLSSVTTVSDRQLSLLLSALQ
ncbi:MAG TPA: hypothetical protein PKD19_03255 [Candidatus Saccharibacteria bacterium]|nr:hypothetical protein [Candidatus Saccharibacteria bacterium]HMR38069.1 hypothetical protein [Candidatus Saccharibacteria bacterium]